MKTQDYSHLKGRLLRQQTGRMHAVMICVEITPCHVQIFLKSAYLLREGEKDWIAFMEGFLASSTAANRWFLDLLVQDCVGKARKDSKHEFTDFLEQYLLYGEGVSLVEQNCSLQKCGCILACRPGSGMAHQGYPRVAVAVALVNESQHKRQHGAEQDVAKIRSLA